MNSDHAPTDPARQDGVPGRALSIGSLPAIGSDGCGPATSGRAPRHDPRRRVRGGSPRGLAGLAVVAGCAAGPASAALVMTGVSDTWRASTAIAVMAAQPENATEGGAVEPGDGEPVIIPPDENDLAGLPVRQVDLLGLRRVSRQIVLNQIRTTPGEPFDPDLVSQDVRNLTRINEFREVVSEVELTADGGVIVRFLLTELPKIADIQVAGNSLVSDQEILGGILLQPGDPLDRFQIERARSSIEDLYREKGHYLVQVTYDPDAVIESNIVLFRVREGPRTRIREIRFSGNDTYEDEQLFREIDTRRALFLFRTGELDEEQIEADVRILADYYRARGYLDARVDATTELSNDLREAVVTFLIDEGPLYLMRSVKVEGARNFSAEELASLMPLNPGDPYSRDRINASRDAVINAYGELGYYNTVVDIRELRDEQANVVDLLMTVTEAPLAMTGEITVIGNTKTKRNVIFRELDIRPNRPLSLQDLQDSRRKLERTRFFSQVTVTPLEPRPDEPGYRDVIIEVEETNTGSYTIGGGISSDTGIFGTIGLEQRNFDLFDFPESVSEYIRGRSFTGAGQDFNITLSPGNELSTFTVSLTEPYLFGTNTTLASSAQYLVRELDSYDETRWGGRFRFGRRFGEVWAGTLGLRYQSVDLSDIDDDAATEVFRVEDENVLTGVELALTRTTLNDFFRPTAGSRVEFSVEQIGALGGEFDFTRLDASYTGYLILDRDFLGRASTLQFSTRAGYQFGGYSPVYERFYLGGRSFRGFDFRTISPRGIRNDNGEPSDDSVGGDWLFFAGLQYEFPFVGEAVNLVVFLDTGTVLDEFGFEQYRASIGTGLRLYIEQLGSAPLAFDFAIPIASEDEDESEVFSFSVDLPIQ